MCYMGGMSKSFLVIFLFFPLTRVVGLCRRGVCFLVVGCNVCLGFFLWHPSYLLHESKEEFCGKRGEAAYLFGWYYLPKWMLLVVSVWCRLAPKVCCWSCFVGWCVSVLYVGMVVREDASRGCSQYMDKPESLDRLGWSVCSSGR